MLKNLEGKLEGHNRTDRETQPPADQELLGSGCGWELTSSGGTDWGMNFRWVFYHGPCLVVHITDLQCQYKS